MAGRRLTITVDEPLLDALHGEGARTCEPASRVAERVLREALPAFIERHLRHDLAPVVRGRLLDVRSTPVDQPCAATPPGLPSGVTSNSSSQTRAERHVTARRPVKGAGGAGVS